MRGTERPRVIDGFASVQAVKRAGANRKEPHYAASRTRLAGKDAAEAARAAPPARRIGRSVIPESFEIVCYACGYTFELRGQIRKTYCPKCREILDVEPRVINEPWSGQIRTIGPTRVEEGGSVHDARIITGDLYLNGAVTASSIRVCRCLELGPGAGGEIHLIETRDIVVLPGARLVLNHLLRCRNMTVRGHLRAKTELTGSMTVHETGCFSGQVQAERLVVQEGGGVKARLRIGRPCQENTT